MRDEKQVNTRKLSHGEQTYVHVRYRCCIGAQTTLSTGNEYFWGRQFELATTRASPPYVHATARYKGLVPWERKPPARHPTIWFRVPRPSHLRSIFVSFWVGMMRLIQRSATSRLSVENKHEPTHLTAPHLSPGRCTNYASLINCARQHSIPAPVSLVQSESTSEHTKMYPWFHFHHNTHLYKRHLSKLACLHVTYP